MNKEKNHKNDAQMKKKCCKSYEPQRTLKGYIKTGHEGPREAYASHWSYTQLVPGRGPNRACPVLAPL